MEHGYTTGDEYDDADSRGGCYGSGWPSADVPPWNYRPFINQEANKNKHMRKSLKINYRLNTSYLKLGNFVCL